MDPDGHDPFYSKALVYAILCSFAGDGNLKGNLKIFNFNHWLNSNVMFC